MSFWTETRGYPQRAFLICLVAYGFSQLDLALFAYAVPSLRQDLGLSLNQISIIVAVSYASGAVLQIWLGHLADRFGRKIMLQVSLGSSSLFIAAHALASSVFTLTFLRAGAIFTVSGLYPTTGAIVSEVAPSRYRGIMAGLLQTAYPLGWFAAALFAAPFLTHFGWRALFLVALLSLPFLFLVGRLLRESDRFAAVRAETRERSLGGTLGELFAPGMRRRTITLFIAQFLFVVAYGGSSILFPTYFVESRNLQIGSSAYLVGIGNGVAVFGYILAAVVGEFYLTRRTTVVIWTLLGAAMFFVLVWGTREFWPTMAAFAVMSMFFYGAAAVKAAYIAEMFPTRLRAIGLSVCTTAAVGLGTATGPLLISTSVAHLGWDAAFSVMVGVPLIAAGLFYLLLKPVPSGLDVDDVQRALAHAGSSPQGGN